MMTRAQDDPRSQMLLAPEQPKRVASEGFLASPCGASSLACGLGRRNDKIGLVHPLRLASSRDRSDAQRRGAARPERSYRVGGSVNTSRCPH